MSYTIVTDTSANLPSRLLRQYKLTVLPFTFTVDGVERVDLEAEDFDAAGFFEAMRAGAKVVTSQIPPQRYIDCFEGFLRQGLDVLFVSMSSGISGSFASARMAAAELSERYPGRRVRCVDTGTASLGEGLQVLRAAELREKGASLEENAAALELESRRVCSIFTVADLKYLKATGRLSGMAAAVGTVLNIKPVLKGNENGQIVQAGKVRGRRQVIAELAARYDRLAVEPEKQLIGVAHADCRADADLLIKLLRQNRPPREILLVDYEPVTGSHIGPGSLALFFRGEDGVRAK